MSTELEQPIKITGDYFKCSEMPSEDLTQKILSNMHQYDVNDIDNIDKHKFRIIEGYASKYNTDRMRDRVTPEAYAKSLPAYMENPIVRYNHVTGAIIGKVLEATITKKGLWVKAQIFRGEAEADRIWKLIVQGGLNAFSVYGRIKQKNMKHSLDGLTIKNITEFDIYEIAVVDIPAHPDTLFKITKKSVGEPMTEKNTNIIEKQLPMSDTSGVQNNSTPEVGNERIGTENTILTRLGEISIFQKQQLEVMMTFAETQNVIVQKLMIMEGATTKGTENMLDNEDDFNEDEEDDFEFEDDTDDTSDNTQKSDNMIDIVMKRLDEVNTGNEILKNMIEDLIEVKTEKVVQKSVTPIIADVAVEEAVMKAVKENKSTSNYEIVAKTYENDDNRLFTFLSNQL